ncbi:hypothetical protein LCL89_02545 [Halobacillus yeomjeoni]|uniref:hypothetical protein n=1 Tax=Halobacillus yeomjeoni TaxID=311194 RepID=UPI001CD366D3|nr:hypothetical protein [Halobacillus yeomjeoni]MCA0982920.1 hypothetical protein [Halobacillus yeomjeoni]
MNDKIEQESFNQKKVRLKSMKNSWYGFLGFVLLIGSMQTYSNPVPVILYLFILIIYIDFIYQSKMSRKPNDELWELWELRWSDHKLLFQIRNALSNTFWGIVPMVYDPLLWWVTLIIALGGGVKGFLDGGKDWEAKNYYYEEYIGRQA